MTDRLNPQFVELMVDAIHGVMLQYPIKGVCGVCQSCKKPIIHNGKNWEHQNGIVYRHPCSPVIKKKSVDLSSKGSG